MKKELKCWDIMPRRYGLAYYLDYAMIAICYPIPINLIVRWVREVYLLCQRGICPTKTEKLIDTIKEKSDYRGYRRGYNIGFDRGREEGYTEGYEARRKEMIDGLIEIKKEFSELKKDIKEEK